VNNIRIFFKIFIFVVCPLGLSFWGCSGQSEKDILLETIESIVDYGEKRDVAGVLSWISTSYLDDEKRSFEDLNQILDEYLEKYRGIAVNLLSSKISKIEVTDAVVETEMAFSSGAAKMFRKLINFSGSCYRFNLKLVKETNRWKIRSASWKYVSPEELFPESMNIIQKLFRKL